MNASDPRALWRSLEDDGFAAEGEAGIGFLGITRRDFLKLAAASTALATTACQGPVEEIVPYVEPHDAPPGVPQFFASAMTLGGCATGVLIECNSGRPTKIEGNPDHPASLGSTGVFEQAAILELWDPERSHGILHDGQPATRIEMEGALRERLAALEGRGGEGLRILTRYASSPTLGAQLERLRQRYPRMRVHCWEPLHRDRSRAGARLAFGRTLQPVYRFDAAAVVVALDADIVGEGPGHLRYARDLVTRRRPDAATMSRIYAIESSPTLTGAIADHRLAASPSGVVTWLVQLAAAVRGEARADSALVASAARDLRAHRGACVIVAGEALPPEAHALVHRLNAELGAVGSVVSYIAPAWGDIDCTESITALAQDLDAGAVDTLVILDGNPLYDAPGDLALASRLPRAGFTLHLADRMNETSAACRWHVPQANFLERWSDSRAYDGSASIVQPVVAPLYGGLSPHEILAFMIGVTEGGPRDHVRAQWRARASGGFETWWREVLRAGVIAGTREVPVSVPARSVNLVPSQARDWTVVFRADASLRDGEFANNAWLQELPRPHSKLTWDNAAYVSPASAAALGVKTGDRIEISAQGVRLLAPVWVLPGQADQTLTLPFGHGRTRAGGVGNRVGFDAYPMRASNAPWSIDGAQARRVEGRHDFATTQNHARMEEREPVRRMSLAQLMDAAAKHEEPPAESLYPPWPYDSYRWGMAIDLNACIGCNACTIACQAENNIATVGKEEVARGREMHWIRVDRYYDGAPEAPRTYFQPVPCMHCETAPCEPVCPVGATLHDSEGLNVQVYNRCVGTRFCSNNCPYKVRRFNFLHYSAGKGAPPLAARNPEVTVRMRGVMEKCNYCLQRITRARIETEREGLRIADGEVVTACQAVCPTRAITFGDLADPKSAVSIAKRSPLDYVLLEELNTRPRTSYAAKVINPHPGARGT